MTTPVAVITGATSGIGRWIALGVAGAGHHHLVLPVRNPAKGDETRDWIHTFYPDALIELIPADFASLASTRAAAAAIRARHPVLALLVNNAGVFRARPERTAEGHDLVLTVNHLAPHLFTQELLPALLAGAPARIVTIGSSTSDRARLDPDHLELGRRWTMTAAYAQSKLAIMMSTFDTARRLSGTGLVANVVHPGLVATSLIRSGGPIGLVWRAMTPFIRTEKQGAITPLHVALAPDLARTNGRYFKNSAPAVPNKRALDPILIGRLCAATDALIGSPPPSGQMP